MLRPPARSGPNSSWGCPQANPIRRRSLFALGSSWTWLRLSLALGALEREFTLLFLDRARRGDEGRRLVGLELDLVDLLDSRRAEPHGDPDEASRDPVLALQIGRAREDLLLVLEDRVHHLDGRRRGGIVGRAGLE